MSASGASASSSVIDDDPICGARNNLDSIDLRAILRLTPSHETLKEETYDHIEWQLFKLLDLIPGEIAEISLPRYHNSFFKVYIMKDIFHKVSVIFGNIKEKNFYNVNTTPITEWSHAIALTERLKYLSFNVEKIDTMAINRLSCDSELIIREATEPRLNDSRIYKKKKSGECYILKKIENENRIERYIRIDSAQTRMYSFFRGQIVDNKIIEFYERIDNVRQALSTNGLPQVLERLITLSELEAIYEFVFNDPFVFEHFREEKPFRIPKGEYCARTLNIILFPEGDYHLVLETKSKLANGQKEEKENPSGVHGIVKKCYLIDYLDPLVYANKTPKKDYNIEYFEYDAAYARSIKTSQTYLFNRSVPGAMYRNKKGVRESLYAPFAEEIDLFELISKKNNNLELAEKIQIKNDLLESVNVLHSQGKTHQDLKLENVLIYIDADGKRRAKLADFSDACGLSSINDALNLASSTCIYESPEILCAYEYPENHFQETKHKAFYSRENRKESYAHYVKKHEYPKFLPKETLVLYLQPHPANDMWAVGIILFYLFYSHEERTIDSVMKNDPLLKGLLAPHRKNRLTAEQALVFDNSYERSDKARRQSP